MWLARVLSWRKVVSSLRLVRLVQERLVVERRAERDHVRRRRVDEVASGRWSRRAHLLDVLELKEDQQLQDGVAPPNVHHFL